MSPAQASPWALLAEARQLVDSATAASVWVWARAAALLVRQALEAAVRTKLERYVSSIDDAPFRAQLLCLQGVMADSDIARAANYLWAALSQATHHYAYELAPTADELRQWLDGVERIVRSLEQRPALANTGSAAL